MISVCVPCYNGGRYLRSAIVSILEQRLADFEVVVVDDASTDDTIGLAQELAAMDDRIRVYSNATNIGLVGNWNRCLELARGEWIKFVFQDDFLGPDCLGSMLETAVRSQRPLVFCEREILIEPDTEPWLVDVFRHHLVRFSDIFPADSVVSAADLSRRFMASVGDNFLGEPISTLFHRSCCIRYGGFNRQLVQLCDLEYWYRVGCHEGVALIRDKLATFRVHGASATTANFATPVKSFRLALDSVILYVGLLVDPVFAPLRGAGDDAVVRLRTAFAEAVQAVEEKLSRAQDPTDAAVMRSAWQALQDTHPGIDLVYRSIGRPWRTVVRELFGAQARQSRRSVAKAVAARA
jgi:glycosyltransferase involved in cell wall biosynthesis